MVFGYYTFAVFSSVSSIIRSSVSKIASNSSCRKDGGAIGDSDDHGGGYLSLPSLRRHWLITWIVLAFSPIVPNSSFATSSASARNLARNFQEDEDVMASMEDKGSSASAAMDVEFGQTKGNDGELDSAAFGGGVGDNGNGQSTDSMTKSTSVSHPAASWLEFTEWLERGLDDCGLEPTLYARCVLSILKQPPEPATGNAFLFIGA